MMTPLFRRSGLAIGLLLGANVFAQAPSLSWAAVIDTGAANADRVLVTRGMMGGDIIAASQVGLSPATNIRMHVSKGSTGAVVWTSDTVTSGDPGRSIRANLKNFGTSSANPGRVDR